MRPSPSRGTDEAVLDDVQPAHTVLATDLGARGGGGGGASGKSGKALAFIQVCLAV
jgi:hypothetical protein